MSDELLESGRSWSKAWCPTCRAVHPFEIEYMPRSERHPHDALDLICTKCRHVVLTLHESHAPAMVES